MSLRVTYRRRLSYNTKSNKTKIVKTPGGRLVYQYLKKHGTIAKCRDTGVKLHGITPARPRQMANVRKHKRSVTRAYGGNLCANAVKERITRAFLIEEQKIVARVLKSRKGQE